MPSGIVTTGWPAVRDRCRDMGVEFDSWQDGSGRLILAKRADGLYAHTVGGVVISIPRQVGKTFLLGAIIFALCLLKPGLTVIWTAHRLRTANETFSSMQGFARRKRVKAFVSKIVLGSGEEEIRFTNDSRILFGARERGFGLGFSMVDVLVFDEAQRLTSQAIDDMVPTTNQAPNPLLLYTGTPPRPTDPGDFFALKRKEALAGDADDTVYIEFSADADADPGDWEQVAKANPSFPQRTPKAAILRMRRNLSADSFLREGLGIWDSGARSVIPQWPRCLDAKSKIEQGHRFALDVSPAQDWAAIAVAGARLDRRLHTEITSRGDVIDHREGTDWVVPRLVQLHKRFPDVPVSIIAGSAAASMKPALEQAGIEVDVVPTVEVAAACGLFYRLATDPVPGLAHIGQTSITDAVGSAVRKFTTGNKAFIWARAGGDITPLYAATLAIWAAHKAAQANYNVLDSFY